MQSYAQIVAQLRSMMFLLEEALRIADEGSHALIGAKISDSISTIERELATLVRGEATATHNPTPVADVMTDITTSGQAG